MQFVYRTGVFKQAKPATGPGFRLDSWTLTQDEDLHVYGGVPSGMRAVERQEVR